MSVQVAVGVCSPGKRPPTTIANNAPNAKPPICAHQATPAAIEGVASSKLPCRSCKANQITAPLLIGQGANDPRVNKAESDQIVAAMRKNNKDVVYYVFPDEGHGFARPENRLAFNAITEVFLARYLGGRCQPVDDDFAGSSHQVRAGEEILEHIGAVPRGPRA